MGKVAQEKSKQSIEDRGLIAVLQDVNATGREKEKAFNQLYSNHQRQVLVYFLKKVSDTEVAEDLKMVTFEKVHANIANYNPEYAFSTWMYKIAKNTLIDNSRKAQHEVLSIDLLSGRTSEGNDGMEFQIPSDVLDPEQGLVRNEEISQVRDAIDTIENDLIRELMTHRFISDLSFKQIAKKMGIENNSTLRVNISRGKDILKEILVNPYN